MKPWRSSIKLRLVLSLVLLLMVQFIVLLSASYFQFDASTALYALIPISLIGIALIVKNTLDPIEQVITALDLGVSSFKDKDFSITLDKHKYAEFSLIISSYNELSSIMREERMSIYQRELLLDTVIQSTPVALILTNARGAIVYSNLAAKKLLNQKRKLEGLSFEEIYKLMPSGLHDATRLKKDGLVTEVIDDQNIVYHLNCQTFSLNKQTHYLYLYKNLTAEMSQKESDIWKQVIRLISHELNNSLAPISSLTNSAKKIVDSAENEDMLPDILDTIARRSTHLHEFIKQYATFAKLPKPSLQHVVLDKFIEHLQNLLDITIETHIDDLNADSINKLKFDELQIEQVIINLIKNAKESGSEHGQIILQISEQALGLDIAVLDRGAGMSAQQLAQSLLPFYSTKTSGSGIGLTLSNDIVMAHGSKLKIVNREGGGLAVSFSLY